MTSSKTIIDRLHLDVLMKIDLRKAYDMVSWEFAEEALMGYGFPTSFSHLIMICVTSCIITVKINGKGHGCFAGKRGITQGDPISPLLFVLVMEYLSRTLKCMGQLSDFLYHPMCKNLKLTYLIFAYELLIFCKGNINSVSREMEALTHFSDVTGLQANMDKSNLFLAGVHDQTKDHLVRKTWFVLGTLPIRYLGLPMYCKGWCNMECQ